MEAMFKCPWCSTAYPAWRSNCGNCGGPLAPPPGKGLGPRPPDAPRKIPPVFERRVRWTSNTFLLVGLAFTLVGALMTVVLLMAKPWMALFSSLFLLVGLLATREGWRSAQAKLRAFKHGRSVEGRIMSVVLDTSQAINQVNPWKVTYQFEFEGHHREGEVIAFDSSAGRRKPGEPLWVLVMENEPEVSTVYPPLA